MRARRAVREEMPCKDFMRGGYKEDIVFSCVLLLEWTGLIDIVDRNLRVIEFVSVALQKSTLRVMMYSRQRSARGARRAPSRRALLVHLR